MLKLLLHLGGCLIIKYLREQKLVSESHKYLHFLIHNIILGEFLPQGSFMIRGKKNFVNPPKMEMGCTLLYKLDDEFIERH